LRLWGTWCLHLRSRRSKCGTNRLRYKFKRKDVGSENETMGYGTEKKQGKKELENMVAKLFEKEKK